MYKKHRNTGYGLMENYETVKANVGGKSLIFLRPKTVNIFIYN